MDKDKPQTTDGGRETLADIAADIRDRAVVADRYGEAETSNESVAALLRDIANRIEAAAKRECEAASLRAIHAVEIAIRDATPGNAAAMRFALADIEFGSNYCIERCDTNSEADDVLRFVLGKILDIVKPALAAPPRNCDRFVTANEAWDAWVCGPGGLHQGEGFVGLLDWLYAPAKQGSGVAE